MGHGKEIPENETVFAVIQPEAAGHLSLAPATRRKQDSGPLLHKLWLGVCQGFWFSSLCDNAQTSLPENVS